MALANPFISYVLLVVCGALVSCGGHPQRETVAATLAPPARVEDPPCEDVDDCAYEGTERVKKKDLSGLPFLERACERGHIIACRNLATALWNGVGIADSMSEAQGKANARAYDLFISLCAKGDNESCGVVHSKLLLTVPETRAAMERGCDASPPSTTACGYLAQMLENGYGGAADHARALQLVEKVCRVGPPNDCHTMKWLEKMWNEPPSDEPTLGIDSKVIEGTRVTANGVTFPSFRCSLDQKTPVAIVTIAQGIAHQKKKLDACVKTPTTLSLSITSSKRTFSKVHSEGSEESVNRCVERTLLGSASLLEGSCKLSVELGTKRP